MDKLQFLVLILYIGDCPVRQLFKLSFLISRDQRFYVLFGSTAFLWHISI